MLGTNSELFKNIVLAKENMFASRFQPLFKSVKDQAQDPSQHLIDLRCPVPDVSCLLPPLHACFLGVFSSHLPVALWTCVRHVPSLPFVPGESAASGFSSVAQKSYAFKKIN